jgi:hypothetical protein
MAELRVKLEGEEAHLGEVAARDVARLIIGVEIAVMRAASVVLGRPKTATGRGQGAIEQAARFRLLGIEEGSVVPILELPEPPAADDPNTLGIDSVSLAEMAVQEVVETARAGHGHTVVMAALVELADRVHIGDRYDSVAFDFRSPRKEQPQTASLDKASRKRLREALQQDTLRVRDDTLAGTLVEADFEKNTARLRGQLNEAVTVSFEPDLADDIQDALRQQAMFEGKIAYDEDTHTAHSVSLSRVTRGRQLVMGIDSDAFWDEKSFDELAAAQGVAPATHVDDIYDAGAAEEEREAFMSALAELTG